MVRGVRAGSVSSVQAESYLVRRLYDVQSIRSRLQRERIYAAYALGQLSPRLFPLTWCWEARGRRGEALLFFSRGGLGDAMFLTGDVPALEALLPLHPGPRHNFATFRPEHLPAVERYFRLGSHPLMMRMAVDRDGFRPAEARVPGVTVRRLIAADVRRVNWLYNSEGQPTYYSAGHIEQGLYHGVFEDGQLVAVAGTHVISPEESIAVVGNVFTHPAYRGRGYGTLATSATTRALLARCRDVTLTVDPENTPAVRAYLRLGYRDDSRLYEVSVTRRSLTGASAWLSRRLAAWRGRGEDGELVRQ